MFTAQPGDQSYRRPPCADAAELQAKQAGHLSLPVLKKTRQRPAAEQRLWQLVA
jgi:hypothetical protein